MQSCCCSLAGTRACLTCSNGPAFYPDPYLVRLYPPYFHEWPVPCPPMDEPRKDIDLEKAFKKIAESEDDRLRRIVREELERLKE